MTPRSLLFVPGDRPERLEKALASGADVIILDLEDSVSAANKAKARTDVLQSLGVDRRGVKCFVRINPLSSEPASADLDAVMPGRPDGVVLPKAEGARSIALLARHLDAAEQRHHIPPGETVILPIATETPAAIFKLGEYGGVTSRLMGLTWGAEDLPAAVGASAARESDGRYTPPLELARSLALFGATAAGVAAIETVYPAFKDLDGLATYAARGARDGFSGMMAIHPSQVSIINAAFTPSDEQIAHAKAVVDAFAAQPGAGVVALDGAMLDAPHLAQAKRILARGAAKR
ncbi:MAG TPA: CoA ester lyase [Caulobacterales bacterium]|nr:CoA ester lyase [Caulobacterales bacterium]